MALVACPECKQDVSTEAPSCPHCGKPLSGVHGAGAVSGPVFFAAGGAPGPEQPLWEGGPSLALLYGKLLSLVIRCIILFTIGYLAITMGLPALASMSSQMRSFIEENANAIQLGIVIALVIAVLPSVVALALAATRLRNTHYRVTNQRIVVESGVFSRSLEEIDMRSVDDIEFHQSLLERLFGIGQVFVVSTDKVVPKFALHGIRNPRQTRELIRANAYQVSQRQLFTRST
jgi:membrane protein YdbS with pleckstrin-like domain